MSIIRLHNLMDYHTVQDWIGAFVDHSDWFSTSEIQEPMPIAKRNALLCLTMQQVVPFQIFCSLRRTMRVIHGGKELGALAAFARSEANIKRWEWSLPVPFPSQNDTCTFLQLDRIAQTRFLQAPINAVFLKTNCSAESQLISSFF